MSIQSYGRFVTMAAILFLGVLFFSTSANAQTYWAGDISVSNVNGRPTPQSADIAHVSLVVSNTGPEGDVLIAIDVHPQIAQAGGFDALPLRVYRGASLRRSQPVFVAAGETRMLGFDDVHLVLYGIRGPFARGLRVPVRLTFQKAGTIDVIIDVGGQMFDVSSATSPSQPRLIQAQYHQTPSPMQYVEPDTGYAFRCMDGSKLTLAFAATEDRLDAIVRIKGETYSLPYQLPEPGPVQVVWSDGDHSLTWSPGVQLMWMTSTSHLMCGRGGHQH